MTGTVLRRCMKAGCEERFEAPEKSTRRYCSPEHDPEPAAHRARPDKKPRVRLSPEKYRELVEAMREEWKPNRPAQEIADALNGRGFRHANGGPLTAAYIRVTAHFQGFHRGEKEVHVPPTIANIHELPSDRDLLETEDHEASGRASAAGDEPADNAQEETVAPRKRRRRRAGRQRPGGDGSSPTRLPELAIAILNDPTLKSRQKVKMLRLYAGLP